MKISVIPAAAAIVLCALAPASARPFTPAMSCDAAAGVVAANGSAVLSTSQSTYDRYVRDRRFCAYGEYIEPAYVQTRDASSCLVGYTCTSREPYPIFGRGGGF